MSFGIDDRIDESKITLKLFNNQKVIVNQDKMPARRYPRRVLFFTKIIEIKMATYQKMLAKSHPGS